MRWPAPRVRSPPRTSTSPTATRFAFLRLVNALLDFHVSRPAAPTPDTSEHIGALTIDFASAFRSAIERAGLTFEVDAKGSPEPVYVDHPMREKIVLNLLSNALEFTFEGVHPAFFASEGGACGVDGRGYRCRHSGEPAPAFFERFHRVQGARARTHEVRASASPWSTSWCFSTAAPSR